MQKNKKEWLINIISLVLSLAIFIILYHRLESVLPLLNNLLQLKTAAPNMSIGNNLLVAENITDNKVEAIKYFQQGNYDQARVEFTKSLAQNPNDPESSIYLENIAALQENDYLKIAVVAPIGSNPNVAQEMLRGEASAQKLVNQKNGINGRKLLIQIVDDKNDPEIAKKVAAELIKDREILAVIGSNASTPSFAAAPIYQQAGVVMITPTSGADELSGLAWRLVPSTKISAEVLADYIVNTAKKHKVAICYDSSAVDSTSFKDQLIFSLLSKKALIVPLVCDFAKPNFDQITMMNEIRKQGADSLFAVSNIERVESMILLAQINQGRLPLFSSTSLHNVKTLQAGEIFKGLTIVTVYHPDLIPLLPRKWHKNGKVE